MPKYRRQLWRTRATPWALKGAVVAAFATIWVLGLIVVGVALWLLSLVGVPTEPTWAIWIGLGVVASIAMMSSPRPATLSSEQSWTEFAVRSVLIGEEQPRPLGWRVAAALVFGPGVVGYSVIYALQALLGLV